MTNRQREIYNSHDWQYKIYTREEQRDAHFAYQAEQRWLRQQRVDAMSDVQRQLYYDLYDCEGIAEGSNNEEIVRFLLSKYNITLKDITHDPTRQQRQQPTPQESR